MVTQCTYLYIDRMCVCVYTLYQTTLSFFFLFLKYIQYMYIFLNIYYSHNSFIIQVYIDNNVCFPSFSPSILKFPLWEWLEETDMGICGYYRILVKDSLCQDPALFFFCVSWFLTCAFSCLFMLSCACCDCLVRPCVSCLCPETPPPSASATSWFWPSPVPNLYPVCFPVLYSCSALLPRFLCFCLGP